MRFLASSADRRPSTVSSPASGNRIDMISRMVVVLPAPFGPITPYNAPRRDGEIQIVHRGRRSERLPDAEEPQGDRFVSH